MDEVSFTKRKTSTVLAVVSISGSLLVLGFVVYIIVLSRGGDHRDSDIFLQRRAVFPQSWDDLTEVTEQAWRDLGIAYSYDLEGERRGVVVSPDPKRCLFWQNKFGDQPAIVAAHGPKETQWPFFQPIHSGKAPYSGLKGICTLTVPLP